MKLEDKLWDLRNHNRYVSKVEVVDDCGLRKATIMYQVGDFPYAGNYFDWLLMNVLEEPGMSKIIRKTYVNAWELSFTALPNVNFRRAVHTIANRVRKILDVPEIQGSGSLIVWSRKRTTYDKKRGRINESWRTYRTTTVFEKPWPWTSYSHLHAPNRRYFHTIFVKSYWDNNKPFGKQPEFNTTAVLFSSGNAPGMSSLAEPSYEDMIMRKLGLNFLQDEVYQHPEGLVIYVYPPDDHEPQATKVVSAIREMFENENVEGSACVVIRLGQPAEIVFDKPQSELAA